jgi:hypothetical protein
MGSVFEVVVLILGYIAIFRLYKNLSYKSERDIQIWMSWNENGINDLMPRKMTDRARAKIGTIKFVSQILFALWSLIIINWITDYFGGWVVLLVTGLGVALSYFLLEDLMISDLSNERTDEIVEGRIQAITENQEYDGTKAEKLLNRIHENRYKLLKEVSIMVIVSVVISANWAYQIQSSKGSEYQHIQNEVLEIQGSGWCNNFEVFEAYYQEGSWPCIVIGSVTNISITETSGELEVCFGVSFSISNSPPDYQLYDIQENPKRFCVTEDSIGNLDTVNFEHRIFEYIDPKLEELNVNLCNVYRNQMSRENISNYC